MRKTIDYSEILLYYCYQDNIVLCLPLMLLRCHQDVLIYLLFCPYSSYINKLSFMFWTTKTDRKQFWTTIHNEWCSLFVREISIIILHPWGKIFILLNHWLTTNLLTCQTPAGLKHFKLRYNFNCRKTQDRKYFLSLLVRKKFSQLYLQQPCLVWLVTPSLIVSESGI